MSVLQVRRVWIPAVAREWIVGINGLVVDVTAAIGLLHRRRAISQAISPIRPR